MYAFVDLDYCLIKKSTNTLLFIQLRKKGYISNASFVLCVLLFLLFALKIVTENYLLKKIFHYLKGLNYEVLLNASKEILVANASKYINTKLLLKLKLLQCNGYKIVIVSGSTIFSCKPIMELFEFDSFICSDVKVKKKLFVGLANLNIGNTKKDKIMYFLNGNSNLLTESYAFSDSFKDIPMLKIVQYPIAVNPDKKLRKYAIDNDWEIIND